MVAPQEGSFYSIGYIYILATVLSFEVHYLTQEHFDMHARAIEPATFR